MVDDDLHAVPADSLGTPASLKYSMVQPSPSSSALVGQSALVQYLARQPYEALRQRLVVNYQMAVP